MSRRRNYKATWNNYPENSRDLLGQLFETGKFKYIVAGREVGKEGTPHEQIHLDLANSMTIKALQKLVQKHDIKMSILDFGDHEDPKVASHIAKYRKYCKKDGDFVEWGEAPTQGKRNDLEFIMEDIKKNPKKRKIQIMEEYPSVYAKYPRFVNEYRNLKSKETLQIIDGELHNTNAWIWGKPGTGKSRLWQEKKVKNPGTVYVKSASTHWWDGYDGEDTVLIEDVSDEHTTLLKSYLKIWLDRYPFEVQVKGGSMWIRPKHFVITSNYSPHSLLDHPSYFRRFRTIYHNPEEKQVPFPIL